MPIMMVGLFLCSSKWSIAQPIDLNAIAADEVDFEAESISFNFKIKDHQIPIKGQHDRKLKYFDSAWIENIEVISRSIAQFDTGYDPEEVLILIEFHKKYWKKLPKIFRERVERRNERVIRK